jgi:two-component system, chemotaxis family, chemotaxis protein CheY
MANRIFLIDHVEATRSSMRVQLAKTAYRVVGEAGNLVSALQKLAATPADIVVLDLELSDGNGLDAIPCILELKPNMIIVAASIRNDADSVESALRRRAHGYLIKPFTVGALQSAIVRASRRAGLSTSATDLID